MSYRYRPKDGRATGVTISITSPASTAANDGQRLRDWPNIQCIEILAQTKRDLTDIDGGMLRICC